MASSKDLLIQVVLISSIDINEASGQTNIYNRLKKIEALVELYEV